MAKPTKTPRTFPAGTLPRALADAAQRLANGEHVAADDLGGARRTTPIAPDHAATSEERA
jgi:hypothetical protein